MRYGIYNKSDGNFKKRGTAESLPSPSDSELAFELTQYQKAEGYVATVVTPEVHADPLAEPPVEYAPAVYQLEISLAYMPLIEASILSDIRNKRMSLLLSSDWTQVSDAPLSVENKALWITYRQDLRDLPEDVNMTNLGSIEDVVFPTAPGSN